MELPENSSPQSNNNDPEKPIEKTRKHKSKNPSRFCDDQIKSLESIFMLENKLEARKKLEIAKDLGLQPRQVAIWFQNRRARWKSKQLEQDYNLLKANYDDLSVRFRDLKNENQSLQMQLQDFNGVVKNNLDCKEYNFTDGDAEVKEEENPNSSSNEGMEMMMMMNKYLEISRGEEEMSQLTSPEKWCGFSSGGGGLFDQSSECSNWWGELS